ncbi:P-loop containing nucleoside triphosphate hydrolase protein [Dissoconium aciculare CBS 342.82]|uniref:RNA helicase n=1 Tax=Dissoconium aciculare CBS 342.82 TaxID=1314786 RepID=A0A6J3M5X5_9PEZI|nr:P-loop containing nucleoside triphosphate hydrolase protein [Dissoconium aciculare CBS 342.82]KAF1823445.1 P-loop containing nucleoside triphosphate hydrolase protein [Dissoconium aciculare CBS 342.82]
MSTAADKPAADPPVEEKGATKDTVADAQKDGATEFMSGSFGLDEPEFDVNVKLADLQEDPNNPLYSAKTFEDLHLRDEIQRGLNAMGFVKPSKIQERALPLLLKDPAQNLIGQSQSGTGKTAAFVLNILSRVDLSSPKPQAIVLGPTRELAKQIAGVARVMGVFLEEKGLKIFEAVRDTSTPTKPAEGQVVIGTPGTVVDMLRKNLIDKRNIKVLTLDEADNMLDMQGMGDQCKRVKNILLPNTQIVLFSATFPPQVLEFANIFAPKANSITLEVDKLTVKGIKQMYLDCQNDEEKYSALVKFYGLMTIASSIIFVKRRDTAAIIEKRMTEEGHTVASLTGALEGEARDKVFARFRSGEAKVLITTNVLARGIDVQTVTMVINYDIPECVDGTPDYETYLHRIGRTGRFGKTGAALSFVHDRKSWQALMAICKHFGVEPTKLDTSDWDDVEKLLKNIMRNARAAVDISDK